VAKKLLTNGKNENPVFLQYDAEENSAIKVLGCLNNKNHVSALRDLAKPGDA
jgi:hypothetical protein